MSKDWSKEELQAVSDAMKAAGNLSYEEFCRELDKFKIADSEIKGNEMEQKRRHSR